MAPDMRHEMNKDALWSSKPKIERPLTKEERDAQASKQRALLKETEQARQQDSAQLDALRNKIAGGIDIGADTADEPFEILSEDDNNRGESLQKWV